MMHFYWKSILAYFDANVSCLTQEKQLKLLKGAFKTKQKQTKNAFFMYWCELWSWLFSRDFFLRSASVSWLLRRNSCFTAKFFQVCHFSHTPFFSPEKLLRSLIEASRIPANWFSGNFPCYPLLLQVKIIGSTKFLLPVC